MFPYGAVKLSLDFTRLLKQLKIKRPELTAHSLRHTMTVKLERARVHYSLMRRLLGHSVGKSVEDRVYLGSLKYSVTELSEALEMVKFPSHRQVTVPRSSGSAPVEPSATDPSHVK